MTLKKRMTKTGLMLLFSFCTAMFFSATQQSSSSLVLTSTNVVPLNHLHLDWSWTTTPSGIYDYTLYQWNNEVEKWQSSATQYDKNIIVLNVRPTDNEDLFGWVNDPAIGLGKIEVHSVPIFGFNASPEGILTWNSNTYKYDVVMFGSSDNNNNLDLSPQAVAAIKNFLDSGRGVLFGHDTQRAGLPNFASLANYTNLDIRTTNAPGLRGSTQIKAIKDGYLLKYPHQIPYNEILTVPYSHSTGQYANGTVWMSYPEPLVDAVHTSPEQTNEVGGTNNFYLTTWNNAAMIQTGHSNGQASDVEKKILANVLWYLSQLTNDTNAAVHSALDLAAPELPSATRQNSNLTLSSFDHGSPYRFYVKATNQASGETVDSNELLVENKTGLRGFFISEDNDPNGKPELSYDGEDHLITEPTVLASDYQQVSYTITSLQNYIHIQAIDHAGNLSEVLTLSPSFSISGKITGLHNNAGIVINYTVNGGESKSVTSETGGLYEIEDIPINANVVISPSTQSGYIHYLYPDPATNNVTGNITGKNIIYWDPNKTGFTINDRDYREWDGRSFCDLTGSLKIKAYPDHVEEFIQWTLVIDGTTSPNPPTEKEFDLPVNTGKMITVILIVDGREYKASFLLGEASFVWTPEENKDGSGKTNWNNPKNWTPAYIPSTCSDVYIPGNSSHYPQLSKNNAAVCENIYFIHGAELGRPDLLKYNRSYVQLNFGLIQSNQEKDANKSLVTNATATTYDRMKYSAAVSTSLARERWYMLSSPLQGVVTGDLSFGGFPLTFLRKFKPVDNENTNYLVGNWTVSYTSMTETLSPTEGFALYMYGTLEDEKGSMESGSFNDLNDLDYLPQDREDKNYGLKETNGILELPFFADSTNLYARRTQLYNPNNHQSTFYKIDDGRGSGSVFNNIFDPPPVTMNREANNGNYRFITEKYETNGWIFQTEVYHSGTGMQVDEHFMVGNPYMSSIDMVAFLKDNANNIQPHFKLWMQTEELTGFVTYTLINENTIAATYGEPVYFIAPMQSFFLQTRSDYDYTTQNNAVKFDVAKISTIRPAGTPSGLRSGNTEENILRIKATNSASASGMLIAYSENAAAGFNANRDAQKLFSPHNTVPEIYALAGEIPADIRFINGNGEVTVPVGIKTGQTGETKLTLTGMNNYSKAAKIELIDAKENSTVDLTGMASYTCTFSHTETGISNGRFSLRISHSITTLPEFDDVDDLKVYGSSEGIYVVTPSYDPVQQLTVYDFQGRKMYESAVNAGYYPLGGNLRNMPLIVKVITANRTKTVKL